MAVVLQGQLNPPQQEAVQHGDGPLLILAGAGSGKTRVITHRIAYLIQERGVPPDSILAVTFTNKAAKEMAERVDKILGHTSLAKPMLATFHSFCVRVLRRDIEALRVGGVGLTRTFAIYDEIDQQAVVKQAAFDLQVDPKGTGAQFHRLDGVKDKNFWSSRVSRDLRIIAHRKDDTLCVATIGIKRA